MLMMTRDSLSLRDKIKDLLKVGLAAAEELVYRFFNEVFADPVFSSVAKLVTLMPST